MKTITGHNGDSNQITRDYFDSMVLETRYMDSDLPDSTDVEIFGETFSTPVATAALSHLHHICDRAMYRFALGAKNAGALNFVGMGEYDELFDITSAGAKTVKIIKPHADDNEVFRKIENAREAGCFAMGMDIDHAYNGEGGYDVVCGLPMKPKSTAAIREFVKAARKPFVIKGVLSARDAEKCVEAGAAGIIVSHHHGIMPYSIPPLMALPEIVKAVDGQLTIFVDCEIRSGMDVFKALALGADAVCAGRALMDPLKEGEDGVTKAINRITAELKSVMARTGFRNIKEIDPDVIHFLR